MNVTPRTLTTLPRAYGQHKLKLMGVKEKRQNWVGREEGHVDLGGVAKRWLRSNLMA